MSVEKFGRTEGEAEAAEMLRCRQIVAEILRFGVSQREMLRIVHLLSLELESRDAMISLSSAAKEAMNGSTASLGGTILET